VQIWPHFWWNTFTLHCSRRYYAVLHEVSQRQVHQIARQITLDFLRLLSRDALTVVISPADVISGPVNYTENIAAISLNAIFSLSED